MVKSGFGIFEFGHPRGLALSRVFSSPNLDNICVIAHGAAYVVNAEDPEIGEQIPLLPVIDARLLWEEKFLVFSDFTCLAAYGANGLIWRSERVCWDDLKIQRITSDTIEGTGYDPTSPTSELRFIVDLKTGRSLLPPPVSSEGKPVW